MLVLSSLAARVAAVDGAGNAAYIIQETSIQYSRTNLYNPPEAVVVGDGCGWRATSVASSVGGIYIVGSAVSRVCQGLMVM